MRSKLFWFVLISITIQGCASIERSEIRSSFISAKLLIRDEEYSKAITVLSRVIEKDTSNEKALMMRSLCYYKLEKFQEADNDISILVELYPDKFKYYFHRAEIRYELGDYSTTIQDCNIVLANVNDVETKLTCWNLMANSEYRLENYEETIIYYTNLIDYVKHEAVYISRGDVYFELKRYNLALVDYNKAMELAQSNNRSINDAMFFYQRAICRIMEKEYSEALKDLNNLDEAFQKTKELKELCESKIRIN